MALENVMAVIDGKVVAPSVAVGPTWEDNNILGAKNLLPYPWEGTENNRGITWTDNGDGTWYVDGTVDSNFANCNARWANSTYRVTFEPGRYWLSGNLVDATVQQQCWVWITVYSESNTAGEIYYDWGNGCEVTIPDDVLYCRGGIGLLKDCTFDHVLFKPMLRHIEDPDDTYEPFAPTNQMIGKMLGNNQIKLTWTSILTVPVTQSGQQNYQQYNYDYKSDGVTRYSIDDFDFLYIAVYGVTDNRTTGGEIIIPGLTSAVRILADTNVFPLATSSSHLGCIAFLTTRKTDVYLQTDFGASNVTSDPSATGKVVIYGINVSRV